MVIRYGLWELLFYLLVYSFLGWAAGVAVTALKDRHFVNHGFLNLPFALSEGMTAVILLLALLRIMSSSNCWISGLMTNGWKTAGRI